MKNWKKYATNSEINRAELAAENYNKHSRGGQNITEQKATDHARTNLWVNTVSSVVLLAIQLLLAFLYATGNGQASNFSAFTQHFVAGLWLGAGNTLYSGSNPYSSFHLAVNIGFAVFAIINVGLAIQEVVKHRGDSLKLAACLNLICAAVILLLLTLGFAASL